MREARTAASLTHPNVVTVYETGEFDGVIYILSAYCSAGTLAEYLDREGGWLPQREAAILVAVLADAGWKYISADFWDAHDVEESMEKTVWW